MASLLNAVPDARLTAMKPRTYDQVAAEPEAGFPGAEALCGGKGDLRAGGFLGTFLPEKSTRTKLRKSFN
jgi:hypothetical protein